MGHRGLGMLLIVLAGAALAQAPEPPTAHDELRKLQSVMEDALNKRDLDALVANVDENVVFTTMNGDVARGRQGIRDYFTKMMDGPDKVVDSVTTDFIPDALSILHGDDMAIASGKTNDHYKLVSGKELDIHARWTATLVRKDDRWLVAAFHYSENVFDNPILDAQKKVMLLIAVGAALLMTIIGFLLGRRGRTAA
jgi:uncharacterized protein (TIGR02246 family)